jgi:predicted phosphoribosyltransferase
MEYGFRFEDRRAGGRAVAQLLSAYSGRSDTIVLGLPRGGVPVAYEVAAALRVPLDVFTVRKIGVPGYEELAIGAIASGGAYVLDESLIRYLGLRFEELKHVVREQAKELHRRNAAYRESRSPIDVAGRTVIVVDDGLATGSSMLAALSALRIQNPARIVAAVPVSSDEACTLVRAKADEFVCALVPHPFVAVGVHYADFRQVADEEVRALLAHADERMRHQGSVA